MHVNKIIAHILIIIRIRYGSKALYIYPHVRKAFIASQSEFFITPQCIFKNQNQSFRPIILKTKGIYIGKLC